MNNTDKEARISANAHLKKLKAMDLERLDPIIEQIRELANELMPTTDKSFKASLIPLSAMITARIVIDCFSTSPKYLIKSTGQIEELLSQEIRRQGTKHFGRAELFSHALEAIEEILREDKK